MGFLKKLGNIFNTSASTNNEREYWVTVRCRRCGETIRGRIDLWNELSQTDTDSDDTSAYSCRKVLMGDGKCFQRVEVNLKFDSKRKLVSSYVIGGELIKS